MEVAIVTGNLPIVKQLVEEEQFPLEEILD